MGTTTESYAEWRSLTRKDARSSIHTAHLVIKKFFPHLHLFHFFFPSTFFLSFRHTCLFLDTFRIWPHALQASLVHVFCSIYSLLPFFGCSVNDFLRNIHRFFLQRLSLTARLNISVSGVHFHMSQKSSCMVTTLFTRWSGGECRACAR